MTESKLREEMARIRQNVLPRANPFKADMIRKRLAKADSALEYKDIDQIKINFLLLTTII